MSEAIYKKPWPGIVAFTMAFFSQWLGHSTYTVIEQSFGHYHYWVAFALGSVGFWVVWQGLDKAETQATWMGLLGGLLIWVGWFEFSFEFFGELYNVPPYPVDELYAAAPNANMLQASLPIMLGIFLLYGMFNRNTKCNFMRWFHRNLRFSPGMPVRNNQRNFARIAAIEILFVIWFCYLFWLYAFYFGSDSPVVAVAYVGWTGWALYLLWKLIKIPRVGHAVRYGIPTGIVGWGSFEMPTYFGAYDEIWLKPFDYPITTLVVLAIFCACFVYVARHQRPGIGSHAAAASA
ncbi:MAG: hypothetical protein JSV45_02165 [Chromatiales bacterium]|nr:MAG: hypothetical protein JSV45_02165 [Chromatiales bacterium]